MDKVFKELRKESKILAPNIIIGKNGLTDGVIRNINFELNKQKIVKIKILKSYIDTAGKDKTFADIAEKTGAKVVQKIGFTISLTKR